VGAAFGCNSGERPGRLPGSPAPANRRVPPRPALQGRPSEWSRALESRQLAPPPPSVAASQWRRSLPPLRPPEAPRLINFALPPVRGATSQLGRTRLRTRRWAARASHTRAPRELASWNPLACDIYVAGLSRLWAQIGGRIQARPSRDSNPPASAIDTSH